MFQLEPRKAEKLHVSAYIVATDVTAACSAAVTIKERLWLRARFYRSRLDYGCALDIINRDYNLAFMIVPKT